MTPGSNHDFISKTEVLKIVKGLVSFYDVKISELSKKVDEKHEGCSCLNKQVP